MNRKQRRQENKAKAMLGLLVAKMSGKITLEQFKERYAKLTVTRPAREGA